MSLFFCLFAINKLFSVRITSGKKVIRKEIKSVFSLTHHMTPQTIPFDLSVILERKLVLDYERERERGGGFNYVRKERIPFDIFITKR